jgi:apolipoprotein N-acyltransferase
VRVRRRIGPVLVESALHAFVRGFRHGPASIRTHLLAGFAIVGPDYRDNRAWLFDEDGALTVDYAKRHLIPFAEIRFRPGDRDAVITLDGRTLGVAICKDMDFLRLARRYGHPGAQAMLTPRHGTLM